MSALPQPSDEHQEDVFSLLTQINYFNNLLEKEQSVIKVRDLFNQQDELEALKKGISHRLDDLAERSPDTLKEDIQSLRAHWNKIKINLEEDKEISELLRSSAQELKIHMDRLYHKSFRIASLKEDDQPDRITSAVQPYFESISANMQGLVEEQYPQTIDALFELAVRLRKGEYGQRLSEAFGLFSDSLSSHQSLFSLLLLDLIDSNRLENPPEILIKIKNDDSFRALFVKLKQMTGEQIEKLVLNDVDHLSPEEKQVRIEIAKLLDFLNIPPTHLKTLLQLFHKLVANLAHPSHLLIDLLLQMDRVQEATDYASKLPNTLEQSKSYLDIISYLLMHHQLTEAVHLVHVIQSEPEKNKAIVKIIDKMLEDKQPDQAIQFAKSLTNQSESGNALEEMAVQLGKQNKADQALRIANLITEFDIKAYTLSRLVNILASKGELQKAIEISSSIEDPHFREDAIGYIVKKFLNLRQMDRAMAFVETLQNPKEKSAATKIIESTMAADHQNERIKRLRP